MFQRGSLGRLLAAALVTQGPGAPSLVEWTAVASILNELWDTGVDWMSNYGGHGLDGITDDDVAKYSAAQVLQDAQLMVSGSVTKPKDALKGRSHHRPVPAYLMLQLPTHARIAQGFVGAIELHGACHRSGMPRSMLPRLPY